MCAIFVGLAGATWIKSEWKLCANSICCFRWCGMSWRWSRYANLCVIASDLVPIGFGRYVSLFFRVCIQLLIFEKDFSWTPPNVILFAVPWRVEFYCGRTCIWCSVFSGHSLHPLHLLNLLLVVAVNCIDFYHERSKFLEVLRLSNISAIGRDSFHALVCLVHLADRHQTHVERGCVKQIWYLEFSVFSGTNSCWCVCGCAKAFHMQKVDVWAVVLSDGLSSG